MGRRPCGIKTRRHSLRSLVVWLSSLSLGLSACTTPATSPSLPAFARPFRVASFNIHYIAPHQQRLNWDERKQAVVRVLEDTQADMIGFQEMETFAGGHYNDENQQLDWVLTHFSHYAATSVGDPRLYPSTQPILYNTARFRPLQQGFFFFSETPEVVYSATYNGSYPAFCSWSQLLDMETTQSFYLFNVHFDYSSVGNRQRSARLVAARLRPLVEAGEAIILLGDINAPGFFPVASILKDIPLTLATPAGATFHFNRGLNVLPAIDHVFHSAQFIQVGKTRLMRQAYDGVWPADHYPLWVELYRAVVHPSTRSYSR